jgi:hypothetical protein
MSYLKNFSTMKAQMEITLFCVLLLCFSCRNASEKQNPGADSVIKSLSVEKFPGKWAYGGTISISDLKKHTLLDTADYPGSHQFSMDTIYYPIASHPLVVVRCDVKGVCGYFFLLVFDKGTLRNTGVELVKTDCDRDGDAPFEQLEFKVVNDSAFYTEDVYVKPSEENGDEDSIEAKHYYTIDRSGKIYSQSKYRRFPIKIIRKTL